MAVANHVYVKRATVLGMVALVVLGFGSLGPRDVNATAALLRHHAPILIEEPSEFTASNGVTGGNGTASNPFLIQGWSIDASMANGIEIRNIINQECHLENGTCVPPSTYFVIRNVFIHSEARTYSDILLDNDSSPPFLFCFECSGNVFTAVVANSTLTENANGIVVSNSNNVLVTGVTIKDTSTGIQCVNAAFSQIVSNRISDSEVGVNLSCALVDSTRNTIYDANYGIIISGASIDAEHNTIFTPRGFTLESSSSVIIANNYIAGGSGLTGQNFFYGISANQSQSFSILNNTINNALSTSPQSGAAGISIISSGDFTITGNTISTITAIGVSLQNTFASQFSDPFLSHNFVYHNNFLRNKAQAFDDSPTQNLWDYGYPSGGNFWSDYPGVDNCSGAQQNICPSPDGIGDTPYVFNYNQDRYPLMTPLPA